MKSKSDTWPTDCPFCKIAHAEDATTEIVCSGNSWVAFFPLNPATLGHTLIIPRAHEPDLWHISSAQGNELMAAAIMVGRAIESALMPDGMNLITSAGEVAEQTVFHLHLHLVPRWQSDGFGHIWPVDQSNFEDTDLSIAAARIRRQCNGNQETTA